MARDNRSARAIDRAISPACSRDLDLDPGIPDRVDLHRPCIYRPDAVSHREGWEGGDMMDAFIGYILQLVRRRVNSVKSRVPRL